MIEKKHYANFGFEVLFPIVVVLLLQLHVFLISLHPLYKIMTTYTLEQLKQHSELVTPFVLTTGLPYILILITLTFLLVLGLFLLVRTINYNYVLHNKFSVKSFLKNLKVFFAGIFLMYLPSAFILSIIFFILVGFLLLVTSFFINPVVFNLLKQIILVYTVFIFILLSQIYYFIGLKNKELLSNYSKVFKSLKNKLFYLIPLYATIAMALVMVFQKYVLAKIPFMYSSFSLLSLPMDVSKVWYFIVTIIFIVYLRFQAPKVVSSN